MSQELARDANGNLTGDVKNNVLLTRHLNSAAGITTGQLAQRVLRRNNVNLFGARVWDAVATVIPATGGTDDLGLYTGTAASAVSNQIGTGDVKAAGCTRYTRFLIPMPGDYEAGETVNIVALAGMQTTVAGTSAVVDIEAYRVVGTGAVGADLCATSAQTINSLTAAEKTFSITAATLAAGDMLDVRVTITIVDAATGTAVIGRVLGLFLDCDVRP